MHDHELNFDAYHQGSRNSTVIIIVQCHIIRPITLQYLSPQYHDNIYARQLELD